MRTTDELVARMAEIDARTVQGAASLAHVLYLDLENHLRDQRRYIKSILVTAPVSEKLLEGDDDA